MGAPARQRRSVSLQREHTELFDPRLGTQGARPLAPRQPRRQLERLRLSFDKVTMPISIEGKSWRMSEIFD